MLASGPITRKTRGRIWVRTAAEFPLEVGDVIELQAAQFEDVPRAGNPGQRESVWRFIGAGCWCLATIKANQIQVLQRGARYPILRFVAALRRRIAAHYEAAFVGDLQGRPLSARTGATFDGDGFRARWLG